MKLWQALIYFFLVIMPFVLLSFASNGTDVPTAIESGTFHVPTLTEVLYLSIGTLAFVFVIGLIFYGLIWLAINSVRPQWWRDL